MMVDFITRPSSVKFAFPKLTVFNRFSMLHAVPLLLSPAEERGLVSPNLAVSDETANGILEKDSVNVEKGENPLPLLDPDGR
jgi:hypothetical protein